MAYTTYHGKRVSLDHAIVLSAYERKYGTPAQVNQGARTLAEQAAFYAHYLRYGYPLAARPWGGAPHIKWGAGHHALDINSGSGHGQAGHVAAYYRSLGIPVAFNVPGEPWHMDTLDRAALRRAAARLSFPRTIRPGHRGRNVLYLKSLMRHKGLRRFLPGRVYGRGSVAAIKRFQKKHHLRADGIVGPATWKALRA